MATALKSSTWARMNFRGSSTQEVVRIDGLLKMAAKQYNSAIGYTNHESF